MTQVLLTSVKKYIELRISMSFHLHPAALSSAKPLHYSVGFLRGVSHGLKKSLLIFFYVSVLLGSYHLKIFWENYITMATAIRGVLEISASLPGIADTADTSCQFYTPGQCCHFDKEMGRTLLFLTLCCPHFVSHCPVSQWSPIFCCAPLF